MAATLVGAALIGFLFRAERVAYATRHAHELDLAKIGASTKVIERSAKHAITLPSQESQSAKSSAHDQEPLHRLVESPLDGAQEDAQVTQTAEEALEPRKSSDEERRRAEDLANALDKVRWLEDIVRYLQYSLQQQLGKTEALTHELAAARRANEANAAQPSKASDEARRIQQAADAAEVELRQSLQQERDQVARLTRELALAQREIEAYTARSSKASIEAVQMKQAVESATAETLQQERGKAEAIAEELESARRTIHARIASKRAANSQAARVKQAAEAAAVEFKSSLEQDRAPSGTLETQLAAQKDSSPASDATDAANTTADISSSPATQEQGNQGAASERPAATVTQGSPEAARLLARASALLGEGNISAARIVLERAAQIGSIQATFALAETYDPLILLTWRTYGTLGDSTKARDLYVKAHAAGIQEARDRANALRQWEDQVLRNRSSGLKVAAPTARKK